MTNDDFDNVKLPKRLEFKFVEAARFVLVHQIDIKTAMQLCGLNNKDDQIKLNEFIEMFKTYNSHN